jgi:predicted transcriptional regulator
LESQMEDNMIDTVALAAELTAAWLSNSSVRVGEGDVAAFLNSVHQTLAGLSEPTASGGSVAPEPMDYVGAVTARKSLGNPAHIISMIDGKPYKTLRRHLSGHGLTPEEYRSRYGLKSDYPMVAPDYSEARRAMAKKIGLGRKVGKTVKAKVATPPKVAEAVKTAASAKAVGRPKAPAKPKGAAAAKSGRAG